MTSKRSGNCSVTRMSTCLHTQVAAQCSRPVIFSCQTWQVWSKIHFSGSALIFCKLIAKLFSPTRPQKEAAISQRLSAMHCLNTPTNSCTLSHHPPPFTGIDVANSPPFPPRALELRCSRVGHRASREVSRDQASGHSVCRLWTAVALRLPDYGPRSSSSSQNGPRGLIWT